MEVTLGGSRYGTPVSPGVAGAIREHGGLLLIVSHAIWAEGDLADLVAKGQSVVGWAALDAAADRILTEALTAVTEAIDRTVAPPVAPRGRRLLWLAPGEWSVVVLLASAPAANEEQAQAWGTGSLPSATSSLPWRDWNADAVTHRWQTRDALTTTEFDLLFDGSHARVYQRLAYGNQPDGIEDEHLFAWAQRVLGGTSRWERLASTSPRNHWWGEVTL